MLLALRVVLALRVTVFVNQYGRSSRRQANDRPIGKWIARLKGRTKDASGNELLTMRLAAFPCRICRWDKFGHRPAMVRDDNPLPCFLNTPDIAAEVVLEISYARRNHSSNVATCGYIGKIFPPIMDTLPRYDIIGLCLEALLQLMIFLPPFQSQPQPGISIASSIVPPMPKTSPRRGDLATTSNKEPINIPTMFTRIEREVASYPKAAMFELAEHGYNSVFHQLVGCIISIRTLDEVSLPLSVKLFELAPNAEEISRLSAEELDQVIDKSTFHAAKARQIRDIAIRTVEEFGGELPCDFDVLTSFNGVGPKCANLALGVACGATEIAVDVHVNRVTTRWGYVHAGNAENTRRQLEAKLPKKYWIDINRLLVPFGKHICTGRLPNCSTCPVLEYCQQVGVGTHR